MSLRQRFQCYDCGYMWAPKSSDIRITACPKCRSSTFIRKGVIHRGVDSVLTDNIPKSNLTAPIMDSKAESIIPHKPSRFESLID